MQRTLTHSALFLWNSDWTFPRPASTFVRWSLLHKRRGLHAVECSWEYGVINVYNIVFCATICAQCSCCLVDYQLLRGTFLGQQNLGVTRGWWKQKLVFHLFSDLAMIVSKFNLQFGIFIVETNITYICNMWQIHATFQSFPYKVGTNMTQTQILNFGKTHFGLIHHKGSIKDLNSKRGQVEVEVIMTFCICVSLRFLFEPKY